MNSSRSMSKSRVRRFFVRYGPAYGMLAIPVLFFALFSVYPILWAIKYVFYYYDGYQQYYSGTTNFKRLIDDDLYWDSLVKQALFSMKIILELPLAFLLAYFLNAKLRGKNAFRAMFIMPYVVPGSTMALIFYILLNPYNGEVNRLLLDFGIIDKPMPFLTDGNLAFISGMLIDAWHYFGVNMLFFLVGLSNIPKEVYESADLDGASGFKRIRYISLPMMGRILQIILFLSILNTLKSMGPFLVLTNGGPNWTTEVTTLYIFHQFFGGLSSVNFGYGATVAFVTAIFLLLLSFAYFKLTRRMDYH